MKKMLFCFIASVSGMACTSNPENKKIEVEVIATVVPQIDLVKVKAEIQALELISDSAHNAGNFELRATLYSEDVIALSNNKPMTRGIEDWKKGAMANYKPGKITHSETLEVFGEGNIITEVGKSIFQDLKGKITKGKYISVWKKQDGKYLIIAEMNNTEL